jgi:hypothetical protein
MVGHVEEPILASENNKLVGIKKYFIFYAAEGIKTNWIMEEYLLSEHCTSDSSPSTKSSKTRARSKQVREYIYSFPFIYLFIFHNIIVGTNMITFGMFCFGFYYAQDYSKWVICRVYERSYEEEEDGGKELSCLDEVFLSLEDLDEISLPN